MRKVWVSAATAVSALILFCWPLILNGFPIFWFDTDHLMRQGWQVTGALKRMVLGEPQIPITYLDARSGIFGTYLLMTVRIAGFSAVAILQSAIYAWLIFRTARAFDLSPRSALLLCAAMAAATSAAIFSNLLLSDAFTGIMLLAGALFAFRMERLSSIERIVVLLVIALAVAAHRSHAVSILALLIFAAVLLKRLGFSTRDTAMRIAIPLGAVAMGILATEGLQAAFGDPLRGPPFLSARLIADGPGREYLQEACASDPGAYAMCAFADRPLADADQILWKEEPNGVWLVADRATQLRLLSEQPRFVAGVLMHDPMSVVTGAARNFARQLATFRVQPDFDTQPAVLAHFGEWAGLEKSAANGIQGALAYRKAFPFAALDIVSLVATVAALFFLAWKLVQARTHPAEPDREQQILTAFALALLMGILANAAVCAGVSGVVDRYQARVIWLVPLVALLFFLRFGWGDQRKQ